MTTQVLDDNSVGAVFALMFVISCLLGYLAGKMRNRK